MAAEMGKSTMYRLGYTDGEAAQIERAARLVEAELREWRKRDSPYELSSVVEERLSRLAEQIRSGNDG